MALESYNEQKKNLHFSVAIITAFFVSWAPFHVFASLSAHMVIAKVRSSPRNADMIILIDKFYLLHTMAKGTLAISATLNPIIYSMMSKKFREACNVREDFKGFHI